MLIFYRPLFAFELLIGILIIAYPLKKKSFFLLRVIATAVFLCAFTYFTPIFGFNPIQLSEIFIIIFIMEILCIFALFREKWSSIIFCGIAGYTIQHGADALYNFTVHILNLSEQFIFGYQPNISNMEITFNDGVSALIYYVCYFLIYWLVFLLVDSRIPRGEDMRLKHVSLMWLSGLMIVLNIILNAILITQSYKNYDRIYLCIIYSYNIASCILIFTLQFSMLEKKNYVNEISVMNQIVKQQQKQYELAKENIDLINIKCHDLKHQIRMIGTEKQISNEILKEIESTISIYDSSVQTENNALNTILTEKSLYCNENDIQITCLADGAKLNFMKETEIYSLFGNALDNAIEAVMKIKNTDKRVISLKIKQKKNFLFIQIYNYFDGDLSFSGDMPVTTKKEKENHGFGLKSIKQIVEKYNGNLTIDVKENIFNLNISFSVNV